MRDYLKMFFSIFGVIYSERVSFFINRVYTFIYGQIRVSWFKKTGKVISIEGPCVIRGGHYIEVGDNFVTKKGLRIEAISKYGDKVFTPKIIIGSNVCINNDCHIAAIGELVIGNNVVFASRVFVSDHFHGKSISEELSILVENRELFKKGNVKIGNNVWVGEGVAILSDVTIGDNCVIGANSVVTKSFPSNCVIGGIPAKVIREL